MFPFALDEKVNCLSWYLVLVWYTLTEYFSPRRRRKKLSFPVEQWKSHCWLKNWSAENPFLFVFQPDSSSFEILFQVKPKNYPVKTTVSKFHILPNIIKIEIFQIVLQFQKSKYSIQKAINIQNNGRKCFTSIGLQDTILRIINQSKRIRGNRPRGLHFFWES